MIKHMRLARFGCMMIGLLSVSHCEMRMASGNRKVLGFETAFRFPVMRGGFFILVRGIVMMAAGWMLASHVQSPLVMKIAPITLEKYCCLRLSRTRASRR
jgi:hypothetical protein